MTLEELLAEAEIRQILARYCRGIDRRDAELVRSCYHADAVDHHVGFDGGVDDFVEWCFGVLRRFSATMHLLGNILVEHTADGAAAVETYAVAYHRGLRPVPQHNLEAGIRYLDRFERRPGTGGGGGGAPVWRIAERTVVVDWQRVVPPEAWWPPTEAS